MIEGRNNSESLIYDGHFDKEEHVCFCGDTSIIFKIIIEEMLKQYQRKYLKVDYD